MTAKTPQYIQFANELRKEILAGRYGIEGGLPGIEELKRRSDLAANTVYRSLALLTDEKLIEQRDKAYFVNNIPIVMTGYVSPLHELAQTESKTGFVRNLQPVSSVPLPDNITTLLGLDKGTNAVHRYRVGGVIVKGIEQPAHLLRYYYLIHIDDELIARMNTNADTDIWKEVSPVPVHCNDTLSARLPTKEEADLLKITETTPIVDLRTVTTTENQTLLVQETVFVGKSFAYSYDYSRPS